MVLVILDGLTKNCFLNAGQFGDSWAKNSYGSLDDWYRVFRKKIGK